ncbi:type I pullulanase [Peribacillus kribbensis]|uniref:type I pullulanase n=1 Tax=Peribacillus kribbensis TaxID=356658 RepID=UPI000403DA44|nr:type I pullulanase [Peribacillus kribbensis]
MTGVDRPFQAYLDKMDTIAVLLPYSLNAGEAENFTLKLNETRTRLDIVESRSLDTVRKYICKAPERISLENSYLVEDSKGNLTDLQIGAVIRTKEFDELYYYSGSDLGVLYSIDQTQFKIWAPTASEIRIRLEDPLGNFLGMHSCKREDQGTWSCRIAGNLEGIHYLYEVCINKTWQTAVDPYAAAVSLNGEYGVIINLERTRSVGQVSEDFPPASDTVIYEAHIRDFSIHPDSGMVQKGKYTGFIETGTRTSQGGSTGLDYLAELGITHVELQPVNDFAGIDELNPLEQYNWGYNPVHFNAPEGSYSTSPWNPYSRIIELKSLISGLQKQGIGVILDVVYNHVYEKESSPFEKIVPGYYFRYDEFGAPSNGTGVGNDFASERAMARKYILDSTAYWLNEYKINGLRFDLMGILDVKTMSEVRKIADGIRKNIIILGEGWDLNTPLAQNEKAVIKNADQLPGIAFFNDWFRDTIKGSTFNLFDRGFILGNTHKLEAVKQLIAGSIPMNEAPGLFSSPLQSINYIESHDNHTLWDKLSLCSPEDSDEIRMARHRLGTSMVLLSQGIPFLHSGQEFFRTKYNVENSYKSPDEINRLDWDRKETYADHVSYMKGLLQIRQTHKAFRMGDSGLIKKHLKFPSAPSNTVVFFLEEVGDYGPWRNIAVIFHNGLNAKEVSFQLGGDGEWLLLCDGTKAGVNPIQKADTLSYKVEPLSTYVWVQ